MKNSERTPAQVERDEQLLQENALLRYYKWQHQQEVKKAQQAERRAALYFRFPAR